MYVERCFLLFSLTVWSLHQYLYGACDGQVLMYGNANSRFTGMVRVINQTVTWREAYSACQNMGYGNLMHSTNAADRVVYTRKVLIENGWPDVPLWIGYLKDESTNKWNKVTTSTCSTISNSGLYKFGNDLPNTRLCVLVNMTIGTSEQAWYGSPCEDRHPFICEEAIAVTTTKTVDAALIPSLQTSTLTTEYDCRTMCCRSKVLTYVNIPAVQVNVVNESCVHLSDNSFNFPLPYYLNTSAEGSNVFTANTAMTVVVLEDNGTIDYSWSTDLSCYPVASTTSVVPSTSLMTTQDTLTAFGITTSMELSTTSTESSTASTEITTRSTESNTPTTDSSTLPTEQSTPPTEISTNSTLLSEQCVYHNSTPASNVTTCRTFCKANTDIITEAILRRWLSGIREDLTLNKRLLSSYIRTHISADDDRVTSKALGISGVCLMLGFFSVIILSDVINLWQGKYDLVQPKTKTSRYAPAKSKKRSSVRTGRRRAFR